MKYLAAFATFLLLFGLQSVTAQNVGIGVSSPQFKLDISGRLRLQQSNQTAGIWLDGTTAPTRAFIGMADNDHVGIYGAVTGWKFTFNVANGNVGIGTATPTATLDVNGSLKLRGTVLKGSTLISNDAQGTAAWLAPVAFNVRGYSSGDVILFPNDTWQDINFGTNVAYNFGSGYNTTSSEFVAPRYGIYNFKSQLQFFTSYIIKRGTSFCSQRIRVRRNGASWTAGNTQFDGNEDYPIFDYASLLDIDLLLEAGDAVWIEAKSIDNDGTDSRQISGDGNATWFSGRLVQAL